MRTSIDLIYNPTGEAVEAFLFDEITIEHFIETQQEWRPIVREVTRKLIHEGLPTASIPQHFHWDWTQKEFDLEMLAITFYGIECANHLQGLMKVQTVGFVSRLPGTSGKPLIYVDYLETAPWNVKKLMQALGKQTEYGAVGTKLIEAAVRLSKEEGFDGRMGLHSLPMSETFYINVCKMTPVFRDPTKQNLLWCEFTAEQAQQFLSGGDA